VCNEKCKHGLGRGFYLFNKEIIYSIRLVPGSNPGQPTATKKGYVKRDIYRIPFVIVSTYFQKICIDLDKYWLTRTYKPCYTVE